MRRILVVDDSRATLLALRQELASPLYYVDTALSANEAWPLLEAHAFDCILTDFEMPDLDGPAFCRKLRTSKKFHHIPIIMLTSKSETEYLLTAIDAGADDFISKDSDTRLILAKIRAMIRIKVYQDELAKLRRVEGIKEIIATYNHEFNNPLTIASGNLNWLLKNCSRGDQKTRLERLHEALQKMSDLVIKIRDLRDYVEAGYATDESVMALRGSGQKAS